MNNTTTQTKPKGSILGLVKRGKITAPLRVLLYANDGVGKTTFAANAPEPIFLCSESGTAQFDVARLPDPSSWTHVLEMLDALIHEEHTFQTLVVDSVSWLEPLVHAHVCAKAGKKSMSDFDYGKGHVAAFEEWRSLVARIEQAWRSRGMHIVLLSHAHTVNIKNPAGADYGIISPKLHESASGLFREWVDAVLYAEYQTFQVGGDQKRAKVISDGARIMHTQHLGAFRAKNRYDLPESLPLDWQAFIDAVAAHAPATPAALRARVSKLLEGASDELRTRVVKAVTAAGDNAATLAKIADHLAATVQIKAQEQGNV